MEEIIKDFNNINISSEVINLINSDIESMAYHYIANFTTNDLHVDFSPNLIYETCNNNEIDREILEIIHKKGENMLSNKIKSIYPNCTINTNDISSYIEYYISLFESCS